MLNKTMLIGNLGKDVSVRDLSNGGRVANFSIATSKKYKQNGEQVTKTQWHNIVIWNDHLVGIAERYLKKGSKVYVEGELEHRQYESDGATKYITEVVLGKFDGTLTMLGGGQDGEARPNSEPSAKPNNQPSFEDDEIPF